MEDAGLANRGVKRTASSSLAASSRRTSGAEPSRDQLEPDTQATALLSFCRECGEQHRLVLTDGLSHCVRCSSTEMVDTPSAVKSWFDEVTEQEAVDRHFVEKTFGPSMPLSSSYPSHDHFGMTTSKRSLERLQVLRRHGREMASRTGWDGSPSELHLAAAHLFGEHAEPVSSYGRSGNNAAGQHATAHVTQAKVVPASEKLAKQLFQEKKFDKATCYQLLDAVQLESDKRASHAHSSGPLVLGLFSHGGMHGITKATKRHRHLTRYILAFLRANGMQDSACPVTSLSIGKNVQANIVTFTTSKAP